MTAQLDIERVLDDFLGDGTDELSDRVLEAALRDTEHVHQRRAHRLPRRFSDMPTPVRLLAAAAILATAMGGAFILGGTLNRNTAPEPAPEPSPAVIEAAPEAIGRNYGGEWAADRPALFGSPAGEYRLLLDADQTIIARGPDGHEILLGTLAGEQPAGGAALGPTQSCSGEGRYTVEFSSDVRTLTLGLVQDDCQDRKALLNGTWNRASIRHQLVPGQPYTFDLNPRVTFTIPFEFRNAAGNPPAVVVNDPGNPTELYTDAEDYLALFLTANQVPADRCNWEAGTRPMPATLDEFVEWNQSATGVNVTEGTHTTVGGHDAVYVDIGGTDDCPAGEIPVNCGCVPALGLTDVNGTLFERTWAVDVDGKIVIVFFHDDNPPWLELTPERLAVAQEFIDSIQFE